MTIVTAQMSVSLDGFYAGPRPTDMQTWLESPEAAGAYVMGRRRAIHRCAGAQPADRRAGTSKAAQTAGTT